MENNSTLRDLPPSPMRSERSGFDAGPTLLFLIGAALVFVASVFACVGILLAFHQIDLRHGAPVLKSLLAQVFAYIPLAMYMIALLPAVAGRSLRELGIETPTARQVLIGALGAVAMLIVVGGSNAAIIGLTHRHDTEAAIAVLKQLRTPLEKTVFVLVAVVLAPLIEELLFRVTLFGALRRYLPIAGAAIVSGVVFGVVHAAASPSQLLTVSVPLALGGIVLAYVYQIARNYWANVITHALFNSVPLIAVFAFHAKI
ncbi:MAG: CPBP family intramembrane metalloprotease [Candidatus Eremiobacteraeota bacterium]|nr:CPBP family intramembrane metalloprotease [Candidatus Eremiobacteraeota bacterium]